MRKPWFRVCLVVAAMFFSSRPSARRPAPKTASGGRTAAISATPAMRRSIRSTPPTSTSSKSPGASRPTRSARGRNISSKSTPLMVNGVLYTTAGSRRAVVALDAATGEMLWMHSENEGARGEAAPRQLSGHGVAYWTDGREERILYVTPGYRLIALDAKTGVPVPAFGKNGVVDLKLDDDQEMDLITGERRSPLHAGRRQERRDRRRGAS